jgi:peptide/nickel transport system permease protein
MTQYIIRRLLLAVPTILLVLFATFMMLRLVPGDVVELIMAENPYADETYRAQLEEQLGLDKPIPVQFAIYMGEVLRGDLGESPWTRRAVSDELRRRLPVTLEFALYTIILGLIIAIPIGVYAAIRQDTWGDYFGRSFAILGLSVPYFVTALFLIIFPQMWFGWTPPLSYKSWGDGPWDHIYYFFWPALLLGINLAAGVMRMTRTMMLEVLRQDYIRTAWSKGLRERVVITRHALKNAMIPVLTIIGLQVSVAIGGTIILESIFNMPGVGRYFIQAVFNRDYPSVQGVVIVLAIVVVLVNLIVDVLYGVLDPRIRYS